MNNLAEISINEVLIRMKNAEDFFSLRFVRSGNKKRGSIKIIHRALYGRANNKTKKTGGSSSHKKAGTIPINDLSKPGGGVYLTPLISHIINFNGYKVKH